MKASEIAKLPLEKRRSMAAREKMRGWNDRDVLMAWYRTDEPFELTQPEDRIRQRWDWVKAAFLARKNYNTIVQELQQEFGIALAQARRDIRNALDCFAELDRVPKEAHRNRAIEMALTAFEVAREHNDADGMAKATKTYILATGIDKDDTDRIDIEKIMRERTYVETLDPVVRTLILNFIEMMGGKIDISKLYELVHSARDKEDYIDYETVTDQEPDAASDDEE